LIQSFGDRDTEALFNRERIKGFALRCPHSLGHVRASTAATSLRSSIKKLHPDLLMRARGKLLVIHAAVDEDDLRVPPGNHFEKLKGDKKDWCSIRINDQWRVIFKWAHGNASDVTITDYH
jgi:proteic killer suppression protein